MSPKSQKLTPTRVIIIYLTALILVGTHELSRIASWAEDLSVEWGAGAETLALCQGFKDLTRDWGLTGLLDWQNGLMAWAKELPEVGAVAASVPRETDSELRGTDSGSEAWIKSGAGSLASAAGAAPLGSAEWGRSGSLVQSRWAGTPIAANAVTDASLAPGTANHGQAAGSTGPPSVSGPSPATTPTTSPTKPGAATGPRKVKSVLIAGDSMILEGFGAALQRELKHYPDLIVAREGRYSTGLTRPDYFDWKPYLQEIIAKHNPDTLVLSLGANDPQDILDENHKRHLVATEGWNLLYETRARELIKIAEDRNILTFWVGLPIMGRTPYGPRIENLNAVVKKACAASPKCVFVDTWLTLADNGKYATFLQDARGQYVRIRATDNIHVTEAGGEIMVRRFLAEAANRVELPPRGESPTAGGKLYTDKGELTTPASGVQVERRVLVSRARGKETAYYTFIPKVGPNGPKTFPVLYLLHGAWDGYSAWKDRAEARVTELVRRYGLVVVTPDGDPFGWYADSTLEPANRIETYLLDELIPEVEAKLPVTKGRRSVAGLSMGGHGALILSLRHPGIFLSASSMSGVLDITRHAGQWQLDRIFGRPDPENQSVWRDHSAIFLAVRNREAVQKLPMMIGVSTGDPYVLAENRDFHKKLTELGIKHDYLESPGTHDWAYWTNELPRHVAFHARILNAVPKP